MIWLDTEYIFGDETIQTVIVGDDRVIYIHFHNGYYSIIEGAYNLHKFLNGDLSCRKDCFDNEENVERYLKLLER